MRLMIVDDDARITRALKRGFAQHFDSVDVFETPEEMARYLAIHAQTMPDVVLSDWVGAGPAMLAFCAGAELPLVIYTGDPELARRGGAKNIVSKPATNAEIIRAIRDTEAHARLCTCGAEGPHRP